MKTANFGELENMNVSSDDYHVDFALKKSPNQMWNESRSTKNDLFSSRKTIGHKYIEEQKKSENRDCNHSQTRL